MRSFIIRLFILLGSVFPALASAVAVPLNWDLVTVVAPPEAPPEAPLAATLLNLTAGWNLVGNSSAAPIDVATTFGDATKITTVWKWNKVGSKWAFYAPSMTPSVLTTYATNKGYDVLVSIDPKEGFWVNASTDVALIGSAASRVMLAESDLQSGWNLVSSADNQTPSQLNQGLGSSLNAAGKAITTAWAWDAPNKSWKFFAPSLEANGGLAAYIANKGYLPFSTALSASDGFWLNVGASSSAPVAVPFVATPSATTGLPLSVVTATVPPAPGATYKVVYDLGQGQQATVALNQPVGGQLLSITVPQGALDSTNTLRSGNITIRVQRTLNGLVDESSFVFNVGALAMSPYPAGTVTQFVLLVQREMKDQLGTLLLSNLTSISNLQTRNQTIYGDGTTLPNEFAAMSAEQLLLMDSLYLAALKGAGIDPTNYLPPLALQSIPLGANILFDMYQSARQYVTEQATPANLAKLAVVAAATVKVGAVLAQAGVTIMSGGTAPLIVGGAALLYSAVGAQLTANLGEVVLEGEARVALNTGSLDAASRCVSDPAACVRAGYDAVKAWLNPPASDWDTLETEKITQVNDTGAYVKSPAIFSTAGTTTCTAPQVMLSTGTCATPISCATGQVLQGGVCVPLPPAPLTVPVPLPIPTCVSPLVLQGNQCAMPTATPTPTPATQVISAVSPATASLNQLTTFTVSGTNLTNGMLFNLEGCSVISELPGGTDTSRQFSCTPTASGPMAGVIKDQPGGTSLYIFHVAVGGLAALPPNTLSFSMPLRNGQSALNVGSSFRGSPKVTLFSSSPDKDVFAISADGFESNNYPTRAGVRFFYEVNRLNNTENITIDSARIIREPC